VGQRDSEARLIRGGPSVTPRWRGAPTSRTNGASRNLPAGGSRSLIHRGYEQEWRADTLGRTSRAGRRVRRVIACGAFSPEGTTTSAIAARRGA